MWRWLLSGYVIRLLLYLFGFLFGNQSSDCAWHAQVNLHERLLENRPKRETKRAESSSFEPEVYKRQGSRGKMGVQLKYCLGIVKDFLSSKKLYPIANYFHVPFDYKV